MNVINGLPCVTCILLIFSIEIENKEWECLVGYSNQLCL